MTDYPRPGYRNTVAAELSTLTPQRPATRPPLQGEILPPIRPRNDISGWNTMTGHVPGTSGNTVTIPRGVLDNALDGQGSWRDRDRNRGWRPLTIDLGTSEYRNLSKTNLLRKIMRGLKNIIGSKDLRLKIALELLEWLLENILRDILPVPDMSPTLGQWMDVPADWRRVHSCGGSSAIREKSPGRWQFASQTAGGYPLVKIPTDVAHVNAGGWNAAPEILLPPTDGCLGLQAVGIGRPIVNTMGFWIRHFMAGPLPTQWRYVHRISFMRNYGTAPFKPVPAFNWSFTFNWPAPSGSARPGPGPKSDFQPRGRPPPGRTIAPPLPKPPGPGVKERKFHISIDNRAGWARFISAVGEGIEFIEALYDALPRNLRNYKRDRTPQAKLMTLYKHWDRVDVAKAIQNVVNNQLEDAIYGRIGNLYGQAAANAGFSKGFQLGPAL